MPLTNALPVPTEAEIAMGRDSAALYQMVTGHWVAQTVRAAADLRLTDHVAAGARTAEEIAELESADPATLYRLMRACASIGLLSWDGTAFGTTSVGDLLREGVPGSLREAALVQGAHGHWQIWGLLPEAVREGQSQAKAALGMDVFEYLAQQPDEATLFSKAMSNITGLVIEDTIHLLDLGGAGTVLDVGGANGALVLALMAAHPEIRGQVLDLPHAVGGAEQAAAQAGLADRFSAVAGDFFVEVPAADYYLLKWILHDWSDEECVAILRNCRASARPGARLLVMEAVVGDLGTPDPAALLDLNMLAASSGQERDLAEFDALFAASGWRRVAASPTRSLFTLLELEAV
jgi:O-methyltransferase domain/Dimerisation domain